MREWTLFIFFVIPLVGSPGPVNILLAGLGANHGVVKNFPFVGGLICSAIAISIVCLAGFQVVLENKTVYDGLVIVGSLYIMYLAIKLYRLKPTVARENIVAHGFKDGLLVTLLNPKFYVMVTAIFAQFVGTQKIRALLICLGFVLMLLIAHIGWLAFGKMLAGFTKTEHRLHQLNRGMGVLLFLFSLYFLYAWSQSTH